MTYALSFRSGLTQTDPQQSPVTIIGQVKHLSQLKFADIRKKLEPRVTEDIYKSAIKSLHPSPTDTISMYLNRATVAALPVKCSRHNTPSRAHAITTLVKSCAVGMNDNIVIICEHSDVYASACAVARAFPQYSRKTGLATGVYAVNVEFLVVPYVTTDGGDDYFVRLSADELQLLTEAAAGVRLAARIVDAPCSEMNVDLFLKEVGAVGESLGITPVIIRGEELNERGFGGIYGVGKAAAVPPALAVLSHEPQGAHTTVAWVGKGIVYDTGGLSIKGKSSMPGMKRDCGGAAGILGAFYTAVKANFTQNLHAVFCLAENSVGPNATRPDDIHTLYSGRTVEINNTDAEGRLVLADGVVYAHRDLKANIILDMATLTGAQGVATGKYHAAVLTNLEAWEFNLLDAGVASGDLTFPLPYCPELHFSEFSSTFADMKNSVADRSNAQPSCAGLFIGANLGFDFPGVFIHVDMATPVHAGDRATGYGVALLTTLFGKYSTHTMLNDIGPDIEQSMPFTKKSRTN